ncbi:Iron-sulfur flavoprotein [Methanosarcina siciliae C2J]|uniref:Iron-sulfur flavoprotein n=4 Tax=Methanosarcina siciliae TaxID=38027 RepID=A0A0E3L9X6_9EURY|nr:Iron-sulfur flavoprotein [Methanosarcina siciliae T4/M]AKB31036.1 Iron-sulfur flavoprotein [Methanosarcina siciliae HI350]AKB34963.1 Iron-sulfur flavoprotein [Methanosarcina siciliae C2J]
MKDELTPVLKKMEEADAFIPGAPIYFGDVTGEMRSFLERLLFQYLVWSKIMGHMCTIYNCNI